MQLILAFIVSLIAGAVIGYLYHKSKSQNIIVEKELLAKQLEVLQSQQNQFREESFRASMLEATREVSKELLEHHKRENNEAKQQAAHLTQQTTEKVYKEFQTVVEKLAAVQGQAAMHDKKLAAIWQSLTAPVKASNFAEIGLENTLKNFGLMRDVDFSLQTAIENSRLRPDAIIYLPAGNQILIDAKTSKYFLEIAAAENGSDELKQKLKNSMNEHLKQLISRDYTAAGKARLEGSYIVNVMYLPNDSAHARVLECDPEFDAKCRTANVLLVTPTSLNMLLSIATHHIARERQERNFVEIKQQMGKVVSSVDVLLRGMDKLGKSIRDAAKNYSELSKPGNRLIGRIKQVSAMGLEPENALKLPETLPNFNIVENEPLIVEAEAENSDKQENIKFLKRAAE